VPELPDLAVVADALHAALGGRLVMAVTVPDPIVLRATPDRAGGLVGERLRRVERRGKHLVLRLERTDIWAAPMLSGRFALVAPASPRPRPAVSIAFGPRDAAPPDAAPWTAGAAWIPPDGAPAALRYLDPTRMGKLYLAPAGDGSVVPGVADLGPDVDDPALTLDAWRARIRRHPGELKALLRNQAFVAGLGNAYSDEVLWAAGLSPFRRRSSLADDEVDTLHAAARETVAAAVTLLRERVPPTFERQVRDHLRVHLRAGQPCPRCGATISQVGRREATSYCRSCQR
jgi:formamidopyrimidine-DNA glycosylase